MAVKKITKRWLFNSLGVILVILIALEVVVAVSVKDYYYGSVERVVYSQAETVSGLLSKQYSSWKQNPLCFVPAALQKYSHQCLFRI